MVSINWLCKGKKETKVKPRLLDLFCGAGGAAMGYHRAGFEVVGVDIKPQPHYPFEFHQADALEFPLDGYDVYHASPPCQAYSSALKHLIGKNKYPLLIKDVEKLLDGKIFIIENVKGSPIPPSITLEGTFGLLLCGTMFDLNVRRHRYFLSSFPIPIPRGCNHRIKTLNPYNWESRKRDGIQFGSMKAFGTAMGIDWMTSGNEISEAIPPVYTEYIGLYLLRTMQSISVKSLQ